jgi:hypothetical protein
MTKLCFHSVLKPKSTLGMRAAQTSTLRACHTQISLNYFTRNIIDMFMK